MVGRGISFFSVGQSNIMGNLIGTDATGTMSLGNNSYGIDLRSTSSIGIGNPYPMFGFPHPYRNVISGQGGVGSRVGRESCLISARRTR